MPGSESLREAGGEAEVDLEALGHPRGTLAIVIIFAVLFALGWLGMYLFRFLGQGAPQA